MKNNMGVVDRVFRVVLGVGIITVGVYYGSYWALVGLLPLVTAAIGFCPAYAPFGFSTKGHGPGTPHTHAHP